MPDSSVYDTPAGAYIIQSPAGFDTKHDSAVPTEVVPDGQAVAIVTSGLLIVIYPDGHDVDGAVANAGDIRQPNIMNLFFIF